jgi:dTDP-4-amino-4,6-dideoxygalactose transaminase
VEDNGIHIGVHQYLSDDDVQYICDSLDEFFGGIK